MTRKDFQLIADTIRTHQQGMEERKRLALYFGDVLTLHSRFDYVKFIHACQQEHDPDFLGGY
jgi:hypothetical protein